MTFRIGTGSWADRDYVPLLTAPGLGAKDRLKAYAAWFDHAEVNASYYATPRAELTAAWASQTPAGFTFNIKLLRAFSENPHRAATDGPLVDQLLAGVQPLIAAKKLGAFLLVLAPGFTPQKHRLTELDAIARKLEPHPLAVELRHRDWVEGSQRAATLAYFRQHQLAWVAVDMPRIVGADLMPPIDEATRDDLAYLRLHGRNPNYLEARTAAERHDYAYPENEISALAERARSLATKARQVHVVANNHFKDFAPKTALALQHLLEPEKKSAHAAPRGHRTQGELF